MPMCIYMEGDKIWRGKIGKLTAATRRGKGVDRGTQSSTRSAAPEASWIHSSHISHSILERLRLWFLPRVLNMAHDGSDKAFVSSARLYAIVPETSNSRFSDFLSNANQDDEADSALPLPIKERKVLFFGELAIQC
jgi:hypothetical protein